MSVVLQITVPFWDGRRKQVVDLIDRIKANHIPFLRVNILDLASGKSRRMADNDFFMMLCIRVRDCDRPLIHAFNTSGCRIVTINWSDDQAEFNQMRENRRAGKPNWFD